MVNVLSGYYLFLSLVNISIGFFVIKANVKSVLHQLVFLIAISASFWCIGWFGIIHFQNIFWVKLTFFGGIAPICFTLYSLCFPDRNCYKKLAALSILMIPSIFVLLLLPTDLVLVKVNSYFPLNYTDTYLNKIVRVYWFFVTILSPFIFLFRAKKLDFKAKEGIYYFFSGAIIFIVCGLIGNIILPVLFSNEYFTGLAPASSIIWVSLLGFSITKTTFLNVRLVISRFVAYAIVFTLIIGSVLASHFAIQNSLISLIIICLLTLFWGTYANQLREKIQTDAERLWVHDWYDPNDVIKAVTSKLSPLFDRESIIRTVAHSLDEIMELKRYFMISGIVDSENRVTQYLFKDKNEYSYSPISVDHLIIRWAYEHKNPTFLKDIPNDLKTFCSQHKITSNYVVLPLHSPDALEGIVIISQRSSEASYTEKDFKFFDTLLNTVSVFLDRMRPYEKIQNAYNKQERQLHRSQKIASMTRMIQDYNHEIRTPLSIIKNRTKRYQSDMNLDEFKQIVLEEIDRAIDIVSTTLSISNGTKERTIELVDINELIEKSLRLVPPDGVKLIKQFSDLPKIRGVRDDLYMVFTNLIKNAVEAMRNGGILSIQTFFSSEEISIGISDTGVGIPKEKFEEIWEPFSSGHPTKGRGLGLSVAFGVVREHMGRIDLKSEVGVGSSFTVRLPIKA